MLLTQHGRLVRGAPPQCMIMIPITGTDVHRRYDKLTGRLRAAEFTLNTLARAEELRKIMSNELVPASTPTPEDHTLPSCEPPAPGTASHSNPKLHESSLSSAPLPTPLPTPGTDRNSTLFLPQSSSFNHSEPSFSSTDWTQRCTAYYAKRKLQEEAKKARRASHDNASSRQSSSSGSNPHVRSQSYSPQVPPPSSQPQPHERART